MNVLFRLEQVSNPAGAILGYTWIDVIAIEPRALARPPDDYGDWCVNLIDTWYICRTDLGIQRIPDRDIWAAIEEYEEYILADQPSNAVDA
jgi:hypothetical protein